MYGYDYEYPYVDFAELADTVEGTGLLPYAPPAVPDTDDEDTHDAPTLSQERWRRIHDTYDR